MSPRQNPLALSRTLLAVTALLGATTVDALAGKPEKDLTFLVRPPGSPDANAEGQVKAKLHKQKSELEIIGKKLDKSSLFGVYVEDAAGSGVLAWVGDLEFKGAVGRLELTDPLPFGAADVTELADRLVEVRAGDVAHLCGYTPAFKQKSSKGGFISAKDNLVRPDEPTKKKAKGRVEVWRKEKDDRQRFRVKTEGLPGAGTLTVYIETEVGSLVLTPAGVLDDHDNDGDAKLYLDTKKGDPMPLLVKDVEQLAGRCIQIRGDDDVVYLTGIVPDINNPAKKGKSSDDLAGDGKGEIRLRRDVDDPDSRFEVRVKKQGKKVKRDVFLQSPDGGFILVKRIKTDKDGNGKLRLRTRDGDPLPDGAKTLEDLADRIVEVRDVLTGEVVLVGTVPGI